MRGWEREWSGTMKLRVTKRVEVPHCFEARFLILEPGRAYDVLRVQSASGETCYRIPELEAHVPAEKILASQHLTLVEDSEHDQAA